MWAWKAETPGSVPAALHEGVDWFPDPGSPTRSLRLPVEVPESRACGRPPVTTTTAVL